MSLPHDESDLSRIYAQRFAANLDYRKGVWRVLVDSFFQQYVQPDAAVLDLGGLRGVHQSGSCPA
jgi:hypothetical protein